jgi:CelD/BcsL family acetyltransferase involved in cellulose biosynthesis
MSAHLELTVIDSLEGLEELRGAWHSLALRNAETTPFQLPEWLISWSRFFDRGKLCVLGLWRNSRLSGLIPMAISTA